MAKEKQSNAIDGLIENLDPIQAAVMVLGGTAAACGIVPPLTAMLDLFSKNSGSNIPTEWGGTAQGNWINPDGSLDFFTIIFGTNPPEWAKFLQGSSPGSAGIGASLLPSGFGKDLTAAQKRYMIRQLGLFCSGAIEAAIMFEFVKNPTTFTQLIKLPGEVVQGLGKLIP